MTHRKITVIDGGSAQYWKERTEGFRLIREAERAAERLADAPMYLHGGYDEDGDVIAIENLRPHDDMEDAILAIEANETAVSILVAQGRTRLASARLGRWSMRWRMTTMASKIRSAIRSGDRIRTEMRAKGGCGRLSPLPRRVSPVSRIDRLTGLMKEGQAPLSALSPWRKGQAPSSKPPPMGKGDGSLLPFPKPLSLSRKPLSAAP